MTRSIVLALFVVCPFLGLSCGCQSPRAEAESELRASIERRREVRLIASRYAAHGLDAYESGDLQGAEAQWRLAIESDSGNASAWIGLGVLHFDREEMVEAAKAFTQAKRAAPSRYEPYYNLGCVYESAKQFDKAIKEFESALIHSPGQVEVMENLASCYLRSGQKLRYARELIERASKIEDRLQWQNWLRLQKGQLDDLGEIEEMALEEADREPP